MQRQNIQVYSEFQMSFQNYIEQAQVQIVIFSQTVYGIFMTGQKDNFSEKSSHCKPDRYSSVEHVSKCAIHIIVQINATVLHDMQSQNYIEHAWVAHLIVIFSQGCLGSSSKSPPAVLLKFICEKWADCFSRTGKASFLPTPSQFTRYFHPSGNPMVSQSSSKYDKYPRAPTGHGAKHIQT